ncbi:DUF294 nucleotidyltransferase-like domain-containing protein [Alkalicoccus daliensis]|uniref:CBS domain-containing protein n=1 Tax=Alkalicoccus daliensis TaxID=745820 RepID=A0A1H0AIN6_9BACI|nr:DUF294 nucleotidyltransferase-like domain-containing protein [Alkalicoccus daliensis]SDN33255.1 CBS domain-containing protein [Alkalicoccus daliensis]
MIEKTIENITSFADLAAWRRENMNEAANSYKELNELHDALMSSIVQLSIQQIEAEQGNLPARFSFFIMGSAGRKEQAIWSDQDHAIVHEGNADDDIIFRGLGKEIVKGMEICGYEPCEGKVMAEEPRWCKSKSAMEEQVKGWLEEAEWEDIRHTLILFDSRTLYGSKESNQNLKEVMFNYARFRESIRLKVVENTIFRQRRRNIFGQILTDKQGFINFKTAVLFPYVNAARIAALIEGLQITETEERMKKLNNVFPQMDHFHASFAEALAFRHEKTKHITSYEYVHHLKLDDLTTEEKNMIKRWMKDGKEMLDQVQSYYLKKERKKKV